VRRPRDRGGGAHVERGAGVEVAARRESVDHGASANTTISMINTNKTLGLHRVLVHLQRAMCAMMRSSSCP